MIQTSKKLYSGLIPYTSDGKPIFYTSSKYPRLPLDYVGGRVSNIRCGSWRNNEPFPAKLRLVNVERGRSAIHFILEDEHNNRFVMFMTELLDMIQTTTIDRGTIEGQWAFTKRGQNYGLVYLDKA